VERPIVVSRVWQSEGGVWSSKCEEVKFDVRCSSSVFALGLGLAFVGRAVTGLSVADLQAHRLQRSKAPGLRVAVHVPGPASLARRSLQFQGCVRLSPAYAIQ
jgi:hypothetical protein